MALSFDPLLPDLCFMLLLLNASFLIIKRLPFCRAETEARNCSHGE